jgi:hypothetical protein
MPRSFERGRHSITFFLEEDELPPGIPLPEEAGLTITAGSKFRPFWKITLEPDMTIEKLAAWYSIPWPLMRVFNWFREEVASLGWDLESSDIASETHALLAFVNKEGTGRLRIAFDHFSRLQETTVMIERFAIHTWPGTQITNELFSDIA